MLAGIVPAAAVAVLVGRYSGLTSLSGQRLAGTTVALIAAGCAIGAGLLTAWSTSGAALVPRRRWHPLVITTAVAVVGLATLAIALAGAPQPRSSYYHVAWRDYLAHPLLGSGAGTFGRYWLSWGEVIRWGGALDAHSLYLETLAELGPIGLCLLAAFLLYPLGRAIGRGTLPLVPAAAGATVAFLVHAALDWDWELPAVVIAGLSCAAVVAFAEPDAEPGELSPPLPPVARAITLAAALMAGAAAIAGAKSTVEPSAASSRTTEAPQNGASVVNRVQEPGGYL
jgi:hypothetical protein